MSCLVTIFPGSNTKESPAYDNGAAYDANIKKLVGRV